MQKAGGPDWRRAVIASAIANPKWFRQHVDDVLGSVGRLLQIAGVELVETESGIGFVGNETPVQAGQQPSPQMTAARAVMARRRRALRKLSS